MLAAEAIKAGIANVAILRTPRPPFLIAELAWSHWLSDKVQFVIDSVADCNTRYNSSSEEWSMDGEHLRRYWTLGSPNDARSKMSASWAPIRLMRWTALESSYNLSDQALSIVGPWDKGIPSKHASYICWPEMTSVDHHPWPSQANRWAHICSRSDGV